MTFAQTYVRLRSTPNLLSTARTLLMKFTLKVISNISFVCWCCTYFPLVVFYARIAVPQRGIDVLTVTSYYSTSSRVSLIIS
jgi:hypothetical protein